MKKINSIDEIEDQGLEPKGFDLLTIPAVKAMMNSKYFPKVFQIPVAAVANGCGRHHKINILHPK